MIKLNFVLLSTGFSIDKETNNLSIFTQIEQMQFLNVPAALPDIYLLGSFQRNEESDEGQKIKIYGLSPSKESEIILEAPIKFNGRPRCRVIVRMNGFPIKEFGNYAFVLEWQGVKFSIDFPISQPGVSGPKILESKKI